MLPNFIIIGAMKGGTTSLYRYIASHPGIIPASRKETDFFKTGGDFSQGVNWYGSMFQGGGGHAFEASPNYTKRHIFPGVPGRMHSLLPEVKLIYVLRDPIERIISHYVHNYAHGRESRSLSEVVEEPGSNYIETSRYYFQLQAFLSYYSDKQILLVESERLRKNTADVLVEVFKFLGLSADYDANFLEKRFHVSNRKKRPTRFERALMRKTQNPLLLATIGRMSMPFRESIERPLFSPHDKSKIEDALAQDVEKLRGFSGMDFADWAL